jgi:hypothetical protein
MKTQSPQEINQAKREVKRTIRRAKSTYVKKIHHNLKEKNPYTAWKCLKTLLNLQNTGNKPPPLPCALDDLNSFFNRFDSTSTEASQEIKLPSCSRIIFNSPDVMTALRRLNKRKPPGPDGLYPRVLQLAAHTLAPIITKIFQLSLHQQTVPQSWKISEIRPIPKGRAKPTAAKDLRPIALTSVLIKVMERMMLSRLTNILPTDESQYAYKPHRGTLDAILTASFNTMIAPVAITHAACL